MRKKLSLPHARTPKKPQKPTEKTAELTEAPVTSRIGEVRHLNSCLSAYLQSLREDMLSNCLSRETVEACVFESLEMVNLSMSISVLLKIWWSTSPDLEMTIDEMEQIGALLSGRKLEVLHSTHTFVD